MTDDPLQLDPAWRKQIQAIGKDLFVKKEMIRLGFWKPGQELKISDDEREKLVAELEEMYGRLADLRSALRVTKKELDSLGDVGALMKIARKRRIERVRAEREKKRREKERQAMIRREKDQERRRITPPYLGPGVSGELQFEGGDENQISEYCLPSLHTVKDLAAALERDEGEVAWLAYHRKAVQCEHYTRFEIPKRSGGMRVISAPKPKLRDAQKWIHESILSKLPIDACATAFRPGASILDNARRHSGKGLVIRLDLKDFFPSITYARVRGLYKSIGYNPGIASVLALLCTEAPRTHAILQGHSWYVATGLRRLPQGAPTSPSISNLVTRRLDRRLLGMCRQMDDEWNYSRYADDMVFSHPDTDISIGSLLSKIREIVFDEGFTINESKTAIMRSPHRQIVTGLIVNETPRIPRSELRKFRALLHRYDTQGNEAVSKALGVDGLAHVRGYLAFVRMVMPERAERISARFSWLAE
jgi:retron-type reverse transcriptase